MLKSLKKVNYRFYILLAITLIFLLYSFKFTRSYVRIWESIRDLGLSIYYYFTELFELPRAIEPMINDVSSQDLDFIELYFISFKNLGPYFSISTAIIFNLDTFFKYLYIVIKTLSSLARILLLISPFYLIIKLKYSNYFKENENKVNSDSYALELYKKYENKIERPVKRWILGLFAYINSLPFFKIIWVIIWAFYFNFFTIIIEFIAYYFYFIMSFDLIGILIQLYKLILDLIPMLSFVPLIIWIFIIIKIFLFLRKQWGYQSLDLKETKNRNFIDTTGQLSLIDGEPGTGKTTFLTDLSLSIEIMFRDEALKRLLNNDLKFPNFPWINFENHLKEMMDKHIIYNLASIKKHIDFLSFGFAIAQEDKTMGKSFKRYFKKKFGLKYHNMIFDYDYEKYGLFYDDNLQLNYVWNVLKVYAQLYFIYVIQCSLIVSNYSIRVDNVLQDLGNFPIWNSELFRNNTSYAEAYSRHAHILDFDMLRLGKKIIQNNEKADAFEFGIIDITEVGKERGNMNELRELKKNIQETNQKNDLFNNWVKMARHNASVDNFPFIKILMDDQRAESLGVDVRQLCQKVIYIQKKEKIRNTLLLFGIDTMFYEFFENKFKKFYLDYRYIRSDNTLLSYLIKKYFSKIHQTHMWKVNTFGYNRLTLETQRGSLNNQIEETKYFLMHKKIYSKRFATDAFNDFFANKALRSKVGLNDLQEYRTERAMMDEYDLLNSYMIEEWLKYK